MPRAGAQGCGQVFGIYVQEHGYSPTPGELQGGLNPKP